MEEVLAIKPDMVFVWDEAWFAYGRSFPTFRHRTAMHAASELMARSRRRSTARSTRGGARTSTAGRDDEAWLDRPSLPDPDECACACTRRSRRTRR